ncbi:MAG: Rieske 2Fe-2S domain-containing protein [Myxococcota bacterium]
MSAGYVPVQVNRFKIGFDVVVIGLVVAYTQVFETLSRAVYTGNERFIAETIAMRSWGSCGFLLLTLILSIGPLARLDRRFLPLLYNRRHLGVVTFFVLVVHAKEVLDWYHGNSRTPQLESLFLHDTTWHVASLPFQLFGALALAYLFVMAATSHDWWNKNLGAWGWKTLHMGVYGVYTLAVLHVAFGALQYDIHIGNFLLLGGSVAWVGGLHLVAAFASRSGDDDSPVQDGWIDAGLRSTLVEGRPRRITPPGGERIAVLLHKGEVRALHAVCRHQGGPLDEGRVIDDCLTCPWHGWQYRPESGESPPPFTERVDTYDVKVDGDRILVNPTSKGAARG